MSRGKGSGGNRERSPGKMLANAAQGAAPSVPVMEMQGQEWGEQAAQLDRQRSTRAAASDMAPPAPVEVRPTADLNAPSERVEEPWTHGLSVGPGAGPEALGMDVNPNREKLMAYLPTLELMASQPGSSAALRQLVRTVRGGV